MGSNVDIISVQNEPNIKVEYVSCSWNSTQMFNFVKNNVQNVGVPIMIPETSYPDCTQPRHLERHPGLHHCQRKLRQRETLHHIELEEARRRRRRHPDQQLVHRDAGSPERNHLRGQLTTTM
jgi:hypothetical protein